MTGPQAFLDGAWIVGACMPTRAHAMRLHTSSCWGPPAGGTLGGGVGGGATQGGALLPSLPADWAPNTELRE